MRISDWSSDVCSSDLVLDVLHALSLGAIFQLNPGCAVQIAVGLVWDKAFATSSNFRQAAGAECQHDLVERRQREFELAYVGNHPILVFDGFRIVDWIAIAIERSEEHTSELQSLMRISYAVFCLKKQT